MIIRCEECGKEYRIDPSRIQTDSVKTTCRACGNMMTIYKPQAQTVESSPDSQPTQETQSEQAPSSTASETTPEAPESAPRERKRGVSLRFKIFILFFFFPIIIFFGIGFFYITQLQSLADLMEEESAEAMTEIGEHVIAEKARSIASQARLYLESHPELESEEFFNDPEFRDLVRQKVGETGYGALHEVSESKEGPIINWIHENEKIVGTDLTKLKDDLPDFYAILVRGRDGNESSGYYNWEDADGQIRKKYMVCAPVEGTPYYVAATTYFDEFTEPVDKMHAEAERMSSNARNTVTLIMVAGLFVLGFIVAFYGRVLTNRIKRLTYVTEHISVGEMDAEVPVTSNDEIGDLAEAIERMQDSIRLSIERLRRRRG